MHHATARMCAAAIAVASAVPNTWPHRSTGGPTVDQNNGMGKTPEKRFRIETESSNLPPLPSAMRRTICACNESAVAKRRSMYHG
ncbi:hypothetical protein [Burkholderia sp. Ac-20353]|uniref:hypothetical protein n=1 Tax=Burkholderia sp. Ac-20353 TaxID=2703894 RepID=UPI00197B1AB7|nr:hypothetical protein [Burkholderia sp. Ac-20353]MBN3785682.1 hypothetical protein [Burkholderia sp. Ac-20353]